MEIKVGNGGKPNAKRQARGHKCFWISTRNSAVSKLSGKGEVLWFHTLAEAQAKADELNAAQHTGGVVTRGEAGTMQALHDIYCKQVTARVKGGTMVHRCGQNYKKAAHDWTAYIGAHTKACDIAPADIKKVIFDNWKKHHEKTWSDKLKILVVMLDIARDQKWTANDNSARAVKLFKKTKKTEQEAIDGNIARFDMAAIRDLITKAHELDRGNDAWCDGLAVSFAFQTGLRFGEQAALRWSAIDFDKSRVRVFTAQRVIEFGKVEIGQTKTTKSRRVVGLSRQLLQELRAWRLRSPFSADNDFVFPTRQGSSQRCSSNWRKRVLHPLCDSVGDNGIARLRWHDGRHFYASVLLASLGRDWGRIADLMGHTSSDFTRKQYGHWIDNDEDDDDVVGDALWN